MYDDVDQAEKRFCFQNLIVDAVGAPVIVTITVKLLSSGAMLFEVDEDVLEDINDALERRQLALDRTQLSSDTDSDREEKDDFDSELLFSCCGDVSSTDERRYGWIT